MDFLFSLLRGLAPSLAPQLALALIASLEAILTGKKPQQLAIPSASAEEGQVQQPIKKKSSPIVRMALVGGVFFIGIPVTALGGAFLWGRSTAPQNQITLQDSRGNTVKMTVPPNAKMVQVGQATVVFE